MYQEIEKYLLEVISISIPEEVKFGVSSTI